MRTRLLLFGLLQLAAQWAFAQAGSLDNSFAGNGKKQTAGGGAVAVAVQPSDQKIVVVGGGGVIRYTTSGVLDNTFGSGGIATLNFGSAQVYIHALAIQSDGRIILAGTYRPQTGADNLFVTRLTTMGVIDGSFNNIGFNTMPNYNCAGGGDDGATAVVIQPDGKIVISGYRLRWFFDTVSPDSVLVFQYTANGVLDAGNFGTNGTGGIARYTVGNNDDCHANAIALQADGRILLAGYYLSGGTEPDFLVMRINTNGTIDNSFAGNGRLGIGFGYSDYGSGIGIEPNTGAIVVGGITEPSSGYEFAVCRINAANGTLDQGFGTGGMVKIPWTSSAPMISVGNLAIQTNGRIVVTGSAGNSANLASTWVSATIRLLSSGSNLMATSDSAALSRTSAAFSERSGIKLFPNPAATQLQVTGLPVNEPVTLTVTDMGGNTLFQQRTGGGNVLLDISRLTSAAYVLSIAGTTTRQTLPFIKGSR